MNKETAGQRIRALRRSKKLTQVQLAKIAGVSSPAVTEWEKDGYLPKAAPLDAIAKEFGVSVNFILTGEDNAQSIKSSKFTDKTINQACEQNFEFTGLKLKKIPVLDFAQAAKLNGTNFDGVRPLSYTHTEYDGSADSTFCIVVRGDSMEPDFKDGDKLIIDNSIKPKPGCFVIAKTEANEATFKKYKVVGYDEKGQDIFELVPLNDNYPKLSSIDHHAIVVGVMVQHVRDYKY